MAAEARAMLDALMGTQRNEAIPKSGGQGFQRRKISCYDQNICPFYCAWGVDVYALFTNTKSDLGVNPNVVHDDAREEFLSLPDHEKDRLGYEFMLYQKLGDLVRGCDRIVNRSKEKLRVEKAQAAKARGAAGRTIDPATDVTEEMLAEAAGVIADLELREEEAADMLDELVKLDHEWKTLWDQLLKLQKEQNEESMGNSNDSITNSNNNNDDEKDQIDIKDQEGDPVAGTGNSNDDNKHDQDQTQEESANNDTETSTKMESNSNSQIKELKSKLYKISASQQKIISSLSTLTSQTIVPLRDNLQNLNKQLYYVKTDTSSDKTVCEVSGNTMSSRDAEERIAAHYAGKQYVGWKMVRDKLKELHKKYANAAPGAYGGGPPPYSHMGPGGGGGYGPRHGHGPPPPQQFGGGANGGYYGYGGPPPQQFHNGPPQQHRDYRRDNHDRSRSRNQRRRSPSPPAGRWQRDRGYNGGGGGRR